MFRISFAFFAVLGACAHSAPAPAEPPSETATSTPAPAEPHACAPGVRRVGMCVLKLNPGDNFSNDDPSRAGTVLALGEARPECFAAGNWPRTIPITLDQESAPIVPEGTLWLRIEDPANGQLAVGIAAPGIEELGVRVGDKAAIHWPISVGGEWGWGTSELRIEGRGRVQIVLNDLPQHGLGYGPAACRREGPCGGIDHALVSTTSGLPPVGPAQTVVWRNQWITNAETFEHGAAFRADEEGYEGPFGCRGQKRPSLVSIVTREAPGFVAP